MSNKENAKQILSALRMPLAQQSDIACFSLLALCGIVENSSWTSATNEWIRIHDIIRFTGEHYGVIYAENSRETFRKQALHHFRNAAIIEDNGKATNSPNYCYRITEEALSLIRGFGQNNWELQLSEFSNKHPSLIELYTSKKVMTKMPVVINDSIMTLTTGKHNELQKAILEEFAPRFAPDSVCLYVGDTVAKDLYKDEQKLRNLGFSITLHDKMPDVVLYSDKKNWIYFIEAVTSVGPMSQKRVLEIQEMTMNVTAGKIFVTAFLDFKTYKSFSGSLAWETEVWLADFPDHMIHFNGDKFLGPRR